MHKRIPLSTNQAIKQINKGRGVFVVNEAKKSFYRVDREHYDLDIISLNKLAQGKELFLDCEKEYQSIEIKYQVRELLHLVGVIPLFISVAFFVLYFVYESHPARISQDNCLFLALSLSLIGCYNLVSMTQVWDGFSGDIKNHFDL